MTSLASSLLMDIIQNVKLLLQISDDNDLDAVIQYFSELTDEITFLSNNLDHLSCDELNSRLIEVSKLLMELSHFVVFNHNIQM